MSIASALWSLLLHLSPVVLPLSPHHFLIARSCIRSRIATSSVHATSVATSSPVIPAALIAASSSSVDQLRCHLTLMRRIASYACLSWSHRHHLRRMLLHHGSLLLLLKVATLMMISSHPAAAVERRVAASES